MSNNEPIHHRELTCRELVELVTDYLDDALAPAARQAFEAHLAGCIGCQHYVHQIEQTIRVIGRPLAQPLSETEQQEMLKLFRGLRTSSHTASEQ
jgi:anti-sigma factor RsiW